MTKSGTWRPVVTQDESDTVVDRVAVRIFLALDRLPERVQFALVFAIALVGSAITVLWVPPYWRWTAAVATAVAASLTMMMATLSLVIKSPRWRLLELQRDLSDLQRMTGLQFEQFVAELLEARGFEVEPKGGAKPDGGIDMLARQGGRTYVVQCKQWRQWIGRPLIQQLLGVVTGGTNFDGGMFVTTGLFSPEARELERSLKGRWPRVRLVDGKELWAAIEELRALPAE